MARLTIRQNGANGDGCELLLDGVPLGPNAEVELKVETLLGEDGVLYSVADLSDLDVSEYGRELTAAEDAEEARGALELGTLATQDADDASITATVLSFGQATELTIASGSVTVTGSRHTIDTELDAASDDWDSIAGGVAGQFLLVSAANSGRTVTAKDGTVMKLAGDFAMDNAEDRLLLHTDDGTTWYEVCRSGNGA